MSREFTLSNIEDQLKIKRHKPGSGYPEKGEYFGKLICWNCGDEMKKYREAGQGGIYSCLNPTQEERDMNQGGCMENFNVYINHCCNCGFAIDSRYCRKSLEEGSYYCAVCGALCDRKGNVIGWYEPEENDTFQDRYDLQGGDESQDESQDDDGYVPGRP